MRLAYILFDFSDREWDDQYLPKLLDEAQQLGFSGLNVTIPFKQSVIAHLDELSAGARAIGAVNTVSFAGGKRVGYNTDVSGFARSLELGLPDAERDLVLQIGCGGAGSATAHALLGLLGVRKLCIFDTDRKKLHDLHANLTEVFGADRVVVADDVSAAAATADGIVNATPVGMEKFPGLPLPADAIEARHWVAEIIYFPLVTALLEEARRKGCRTIDGRGMVVHQAAEAFEIFTNRKVDRERMAASFETFIGGDLRSS